MKTKENIERTDYLYRLLWVFLNSVFRQFYRRIVVLGKENLPRGESFFVTPNHQNSMMDAMAILFTIGRPNPVFMARADIFKKKFVASLLYFLKILPVFRIRDGKDSLQNNDRIFQQTVDIVEKGVPLIIYPEGSHLGQRRFRGAKKGIIRTAFSALERFGGEKKLFIVPTGIEYNASYEHAMQNLVVFYGEPILVNDFWDLYHEDKARAERRLQLELNRRMTDQMIDIKSEQYYDLYDVVRESACGEVMKQRGEKWQPDTKLYAQQDILKVLEDLREEDEQPFAALQKKARVYAALLEQLKLKDRLFDKKKYAAWRLFVELLVAIVCFPFALYGFLVNGLQYALINRMADKKKDPQWRSTVRYAMGIAFIPLTHLLLTLAACFVFDNNWWAFAALLTFVGSGYFYMRYRVWVKKILGRFRYNALRRRPSADFNKLLTIRAEINSFVLQALTGNEGL